MAAEIGLLSMTQIQKLPQSQHQHQHQHHQNQPQPEHQPNPNSTSNPIASTSTWMWRNPREQLHEDDDSWEVRAFAEDTRDIMAATWPPRSYTCTFCRREFRSAQALGGHMNVHRRDRAARLHQPHPAAGGSFNNLSSSSQHPTISSFMNIPPQELAANAGLCLLYHLPSPNSASFSTPSLIGTTRNACGNSTLPFYTANNLMMPSCSSSFDFPVAKAAAAGINGFSSSYCFKSRKVEEPTSSTTNNNGHHQEELDLELRLGRRQTPI